VCKVAPETPHYLLDEECHERSMVAVKTRDPLPWPHAQVPCNVCCPREPGLRRQGPAPSGFDDMGEFYESSSSVKYW
jgi:hypothetical protein